MTDPNRRIPPPVDRSPVKHQTTSARTIEPNSSPKNKSLKHLSTLKDKIETSDFDEKSVVFLSKIVEDLRNFQDSVNEEYRIRDSIMSNLMLPNRLQNLEQARVALEAQIQRRQPHCVIIRENQNTITTAMENLNEFLKQFVDVAPDVLVYGDRVLENLKMSNDFSTVLKEVISGNQNEDVMHRLFTVFRESIEQTNEDKAYFLDKLKTHNEIAEQMGEFIQTMNETFENTDDENKDDEKTNKEVSGYAGIQLKKAEGSLQNAIGIIEKEIEQVRNKRQEYQTMFENFDQKANQLFNILSTVMKSIKAMQSSVTRNLL